MALDGAEAPVLMTAHREFREPDLQRVKERPIMQIMMIFKGFQKA